MKNNFFFYALIFLFLGACSSSKNTAFRVEKLKKEAKTFSLSIVEAYFSIDCNFVFESLSDSVILMNGKGAVSIKGMEDKICQSTERAVRDKEKTYKDYLESYKIEILSPKELEDRFKIKLPTYYKRESTDFFFLGSKRKVAESPNFIWNDMFVFLVRKTEHNWKLKGAEG